VRTVILGSWRGGDPTREKALEFVRRWYAPLNLPLVMADTEGVWSKARALNNASELAGPWDVALILDLDCIVPLVQVQRAIGFVDRTGQSAWPFRQYRRLTEDATRRVYAGASPELVPWVKGFTGDDGGAFVIPRRLWDWLGGLDDRLVGWGGEDNLLSAASRALTGEPGRSKGHGYHLWHQLSLQNRDPNWPAVRDLISRYRRARHDPAAFLAIRREALNIPPVENDATG